jgi:hypothetical protein
MTRDEMIAMVRCVQALDGTENEIDDLVGTLVRLVPHAKISDIIHRPPNRIQLSAEEIVDEALRREAAWPKATN